MAAIHLTSVTAMYSRNGWEDIGFAIWLLNNTEYDSATGSKMKQTNMEKSEKCNYPLITDHSDWILGAIRITCPSIVRQLFWIRKLRNIEIPPSAYGLLPATNMASSSGGNEQNCSFATIIAGTSQKNNESLFFVLNGKVCKKKFDLLG